MTFRETVENHWIVLAGVLMVATSAITVAVLDKTRLEPLQDELDQLRGGGKHIEAPDKSTPAAGALVVDFHGDIPVMLGVMQLVDGQLVFSPPAGKIKDENDETAVIAAIRETREETGLTVVSREILGKATSGNPNFILVHCELAVPAPKHGQPDTEAVGYIWCTPDNIPEASWRFPGQREWVLDRFDYVVLSMIADRR